MRLVEVAGTERQLAPVDREWRRLPGEPLELTLRAVREGAAPGPAFALEDYMNSTPDIRGLTITQIQQDIDAGPFVAPAESAEQVGVIVMSSLRANSMTPAASWLRPTPPMIPAVTVLAKAPRKIVTSHDRR